jgi:hypothetical protein
MQINFGPRKIQVISGSAFISLPKTWIKTWISGKATE